MKLPEPVRSGLVVCRSLPFGWRGRFSKTFRFGWLLCWVFGGMLSSSPALFGQQQVTIEHADELSYSERAGQRLRKLVGDVHLRQQQTQLWCDSAVQVLDSQLVYAYGHVRFREGDSVRLFGDFLRYNAGTRVARVRGDVRLEDGELTLRTDSITYRGQEKTAFYTSGGRLTDRENRLTSRVGLYYTESKQLYFRDSVRLRNPQFRLEADTLQYSTTTRTAYFLGPTHIRSEENTIFCRTGYYDTRAQIGYFGQGSRLYSPRSTLESDSLFYQRPQGRARSIGYTVLHDSLQKVTATGYFARLIEADSTAYLTDSAQAIYPMDNDTLYLHADTLRIGRDSTGERQLRAYYNARLWSRQMQAVCDSMVFLGADTQLVLLGAPALWQEQYQITSDTVRMYLRKGHVDSVDFRRNAFVCGYLDSTKFNQIRGKNMRAHFRDNELRRIDVSGNGQAVYYLEADKGPGYMGVNRIDASDVVIYVRERELAEITFITQPEATLYPIGQAPAPETRLKGLRWRGSERPRSRRDIFTPPIASAKP